MNSEMSNGIDMNERYLEKLKKLSKGKLARMVLRLQNEAKTANRPLPAPRTNETIKKPVPKARKSVKQMVNEYEDLILPPFAQFRDGYKPVPAPRPVKRPVPIPRTTDGPLQMRGNQIARRPPKPKTPQPPPPIKEH